MYVPMSKCVLLSYMYIHVDALKNSRLWCYYSAPIASSPVLHAENGTLKSWEKPEDKASVPIKHIMHMDRKLDISSDLE